MWYQKRSAFLLLVLLWLAPWQAFAQARMERDGVALYWGLVPGAVVEDKHALADLHGGPRNDGGQVHHLVVAVFDAASGRRIGDAIVRAQLSESGIVDEVPKYLPPMPIEGQPTSASPRAARTGSGSGSSCRAARRRSNFRSVPARPMAGSAEMFTSSELE